jgi:ABC-type spermidine/putrescine transport system permease subunit II
MLKKRYFSVYNDFKTGFLSRLCLIIGIFLIFTYTFFKISSFIIGSNTTGLTQQIYDISHSKTPDSILAFSLIFIASSIIFYFFYNLFSKLSKIADEIEKDEKFEEFK